MPRLTPLHGKTLKCIFEKAAFIEDTSRKKGTSHIVLEKPGCLRPVIIPKYDQVGRDIITQNMKTAGLSRESFFKYLSKC